MARKKFYNSTDKSKSEQIWKCGLYIRLSREDGDKAVSNSIVNQKRLLEYYIEDSAELSHHEFFIDENYTGTNFKRPAFQDMISKLKSKELNCVIVKDLSRFAREYIGAGHYIENIFPQLECRFISVIDDIDTYINPESATGLSLRIKLIYHDYVSQRTSKAVRDVKDKQREQGLYIGKTPFGYLKNPDNPYKLIVDEQVKPIINQIFDDYISGMGFIKIAKKLNDMGITTRSAYRKTKNLSNSDNSCHWNPSSVRQILINKVYMGTVAQKKRTTRNYKDRKEIYLDEKDQYILHNMHEPIISKDKFMLVQELINNSCYKTSPNENKLYVLSGFLKCMDCGYGMMRNQTLRRGKMYVYYKCRSYNQRGENVCSVSHSMREDHIIEAVRVAINAQIKALVNLKNLVKYINDKKASQIKSIDFNRLISSKEKLITANQELKMSCYVDWKSNVINQSDYQFMSKKYDEKNKILEKEILTLKQQKSSLENIIMNKRSWIDEIIENGYIEKLDRDILVKLVRKIEIGRNKKIHIEFRFKDEYESLSNYVFKNGEYLGVVG